MSHEKLPRVFLSYSSRDRSEVEVFDLEMRRRGVPLWRDRDNLTKGRVTESVIKKAAREAAGFTFYLTRNAAHSEWVRERERAYALENAKRDESFGILPVFRGDKDKVTQMMIDLGQSKSRARRASPYDLRRFNGYLIDPKAVRRGQLDQALREASEAVLCSLLATLAERQRRSPGARLRIGAATRSGPALSPHELDLLIDWTYDYPAHKSFPTAGTAEATLNPALESLWNAIRSAWGQPSLQIIPHCHLTMALALGFRFRRNSGYDLEVVDPHSGDLWSGPARPLDPDPTLWDNHKTRALGSGKGLVVVVGISRAFDEDVGHYLQSASLDIGKMLVFEPKQGPSLTSMVGVAPLTPHRMVMAVVERISNEQSAGLRGPVHLFTRVPAPFAILLGQQLSNVGLVQAYEWSDSQLSYTPSFRFSSS